MLLAAQEEALRLREEKEASDKAAEERARQLAATEQDGGKSNFRIGVKIEILIHLLLHSKRMTKQVLKLVSHFENFFLAYVIIKILL